MAITTIGIGAAPNDGGGDDLRTAGAAINANFAELDDRTGGVGGHASAPADSLYLDSVGSVGIGTLSPSAKLEIEDLDTEAIGFLLDINDMGDVSTQYGGLGDLDVGDFAPSQNTFHYGWRTTLTATAVDTPTDGNGDRYYAYGDRADVDVGSAYWALGGHFQAEVEGGDVTQSGKVVGVYGQGKSSSSDATGGGPDIIGGDFLASAAHTAGASDARAVRAEVQQDGAGGILTTAYAVSADIDHNAGTMTAAAQFKGLTTGSPATSWGVHSGGAGKHYFEAADASGELFKIDATNASFAGDALVIEADPAAGTGFDLIVANANAGGDPVFRVRGDGQVTADGSFTGGGADYAELYEWADGNPDGQDRVGLSVVSDGGGKIREARKDDNPAKIIGVVSGAPVVLGDAAAMAWTGKYLKDDFNRPLLETYAVLEWIDEIEDVITVTETQIETRDVILRDDAGAPMLDDLERPITKRVKVPVDAPVEKTRIRRVPRSYAADQIPDGVTPPKSATRRTTDGRGQALTRRRINPAYDPAQPYTERQARPEYAAIGSHGKLRVRKGQQIGDRWIYHGAVSDGVEEWVVR